MDSCTPEIPARRIVTPRIVFLIHHFSLLAQAKPKKLIASKLAAGEKPGVPFRKGGIRLQSASFVFSRIKLDNI